jgi:hypothetical protein
MAMKTTFSFVLLFFSLIVFSNAQTQDGWSIPKDEIVMKDDQGGTAKMWVDPGFDYADLSYQGRSFRVFYNRNNPKFKHARIVDNDSKMQIGKGKGGLFGGSGKFIFVNGDEINVRQKNDPNGYEIVSPNGILFKVENHGVSPVKTGTETEFLAQSFFLFRRIKATQTPTSQVIVVTSLN